MSYQYNNRANLSNRGRAVRGHRDSDATLTDFQTTDFERPLRCDYAQPEERYDDQLNKTRYSLSEREFAGSSDPYAVGGKYHHQDSRPRRRSVRLGNETYKRSSLSSTPESPYRMHADESSSSGPGSCRDSRDLHREQNHDYDFGCIQDEDYDDHSTSASVKGRGDHDYRDRNLSNSLPQPVTAQVLPSSVQYAFLPFAHPRKEKKASLTKRLKKAFKEMTANPENEILGCAAGHPTPAHILDMEAEQEALEEEKRREVQRERDERVRQSNLRKRAMHAASKYNHEPQRRPADREFTSNDDIARYYNRELDPRENDKTVDYIRRSAQDTLARHQPRI